MSAQVTISRKRVRSRMGLVLVDGGSICRLRRYGRLWQAKYEHVRQTNESYFGKNHTTLASGGIVPLGCHIGVLNVILGGWCG